MPPKEPSAPEKTLQQIVDDLGLYPVEAFQFVQNGLMWTVDKVHGPDEEAKTEHGPRRARGEATKGAKSSEGPASTRHISGQQLCEGLRQYAIERWGMLAGVVLRRWNVRATLDFGRIVFALVDGGHMHKTERDSLEDFRNVFDFDRAFDSEMYTFGTRP